MELNTQCYIFVEFYGVGEGETREERFNARYNIIIENRSTRLFRDIGLYIIMSMNIFKN